MKTKIRVTVLLLFTLVSSIAAANSLVAYVSQTAGDAVSMISLETLAVLDTIPVGENPRAMVLSPDGTRLYVANYSSDNVSVIDSLSHSVIATVPVGDSPLALAVSRDGQHVYVANSGSSSISVIGTGSNILETNVPTSSTPSAIAYHPLRNELWLGFDSLGSTTLAVISADDFSTLASHTTSSRIYASGGLNFKPDGSEVFATELCGCCGRFHRISGVHTNGNITILEPDLFPTGNWPAGVAVHPSNGTAYFAQQGHCSNPPAPRISELGGANRVLELSQIPVGLAITPEGDRLCVVTTNSLQILDVATFAPLTNLSLPGQTHAIALGRVNLSPTLEIRISQVELCWQTAQNTWYQLQYRSSFTTNQWSALSTNWATGNGGRFCTSDAVLPGAPQRFYRLAITNSPPQ